MFFEFIILLPRSFSIIKTLNLKSTQRAQCCIHNNATKIHHWIMLINNHSQIHGNLNLNKQIINKKLHKLTSTLTGKTKNCNNLLPLTKKTTMRVMSLLHAKLKRMINSTHSFFHCLCNCSWIRND